MHIYLENINTFIEQLQSQIFKVALIFSLEVTKQVYLQLNNLLMITHSDDDIHHKLSDTHKRAQEECEQKTERSSLLWIPNYLITEVDFSNQAHGDCLSPYKEQRNLQTIMTPSEQQIHMTSPWRKTFLIFN